MPPAQDHKRISDGGLGPNTGEIGCYAPTKIATSGVIREIEETILRPTFEGMRKEGEASCGT
ncbi:phosphoribosylglycinamide synthetase [Hyaloscypha bicolor E]|uniref:Phosphoribosylglycinamide synthetase n=1 Tax=Hyaloscypha bicolor E TaxID=1095630 RepID=A0A2J6TL57_9HELO|nr:phosphoribosylglycinamide synthetase [Hyaloscypha bicolor E]PMD63751.1 phosphoribosylglycinamide synthetase [Hyaloscypha bicolor E]